MNDIHISVQEVSCERKFGGEHDAIDRVLIWMIVLRAKGIIKESCIVQYVQYSKMMKSDGTYDRLDGGMEFHFARLAPYRLSCQAALEGGVGP